MNWVSAAAVFGLVGVGCGAFGAHGLEARVTAEELAWWETGARYQLVHAVALGVAGVALRGGHAARAGWAFTAGILLFSGTLYAMTLGAPRWFGAITPLGGISLMVGWLFLAIGARGRP